MPPKKKARVSLPETPAPAPPAPAPAQQPDAALKPGTDPDSLVADPWNAEQETALLKGVIKWKPVGYSPGREKHTSIPNIWKKLGTMYNLAGLDEREDPMVFDGSEDFEEDNGLYCPFELPAGEYGEMMFERRLAPDSMSSPPMSMAGGSNLAHRQFLHAVVSDLLVVSGNPPVAQEQQDYRKQGEAKAETKPPHSTLIRDAAVR
ncbi:hypothetical protein KEM56_004343 [Ascosphaera pollenicola]|nr:hypothetical protein KEM56_004343 [Ascosphaera pollenicola]